MGKERFDKRRIHDMEIKTVIIRLDYAGVIDSSELVRLFDKRFPSAFKNRQEIHNSEFTINLRKDELKDISESLSIPVSVIQKEKVFRYIGMKNVACKVTMDISQYYLCMTINCEKNYDGLNQYVDCFKGAITVFSESVNYFQPKRLGLRKIRVQKEANINTFGDVFEQQVFESPDYNLPNPVKLKSEYFDFIECPEKNNIRFNIRRVMERLLEKTGNSEKKIYQSILDIDTYYKSDSLSHINDLLNQANVLEFEVYRSCMKESYLYSIYK